MVLEWISSELVLSSMFERKLFFFTRKSDVIIRQRKYSQELHFLLFGIYFLFLRLRDSKNHKAVFSTGCKFSLISGMGIKYIHLTIGLLTEIKCHI